MSDQASPENPDLGAVQARLMIRSGFEKRSSALEAVAECIAEDDPGVNSNAHSELLVDREIRALTAEQGEWNHPTDCDRFDDAFEELKNRAIAARHHYSCCGTCGTYEIGLELDYLQASGRTVRGYTFYHAQDTESAIDGHGLYLSYGHADDSDGDLSVEIGQEVHDVLSDRGFQPEWDGTIQKRIFVPLQWQRPWPPSAPDVVPPEALERRTRNGSGRNGTNGETIGFWRRFFRKG